MDSLVACITANGWLNGATTTGATHIKVENKQIPLRTRLWHFRRHFFLSANDRTGLWPSAATRPM
ncbi:MAG TPA: hypothetical protein VJU59_32615, partial [Paraburkholderia sp.]|uniref:hypothetical protein n=1 Tax=Paraburkholderia sp. TaxID=1926495 RepID=UPI002B45EBA4